MKMKWWIIRSATLLVAVILGGCVKTGWVDRNGQLQESVEDYTENSLVVLDTDQQGGIGFLTYGGSLRLGDTPNWKDLLTYGWMLSEDGVEQRSFIIRQTHQTKISVIAYTPTTVEYPYLRVLEQEGVPTGLLAMRQPHDLSQSVNLKATDWMRAQVLPQVTTLLEPVFRSIMTTVFVTSYGTGQITDLKIKGCYTSGEYNLSEQRWGSYGNAYQEVSIPLTDGAIWLTDEPQRLHPGYYLYMIPQTLPKTAEITYQLDGATKSVKLSPTGTYTWNRGQVIEYKLRNN